MFTVVTIFIAGVISKVNANHVELLPSRKVTLQVGGLRVPQNIVLHSGSLQATSVSQEGSELNRIANKGLETLRNKTESVAVIATCFSKSTF